MSNAPPIDPHPTVGHSLGVMAGQTPRGAERWILSPVRPQGQLFLRGALSATLVVLCYSLPWEGLRAATNTTLVLVSEWLGVPAQRVSFDILEIAGARFQQAVGCTFLDYFFASIPLLWDRSASLTRNARTVALMFVGLFAFNVVRLEIGLVSYYHGVPWWLGHEVVAGVAQFLVIFYVVRQQIWKRAPRVIPA